jgi:hypothetical protein
MNTKKPQSTLVKSLEKLEDSLLDQINEAKAIQNLSYNFLKTWNSPFPTSKQE